jgi:hypothetical protein
MPLDRWGLLSFVGDGDLYTMGILCVGVQLESESVLLKVNLFGDPVLAMWLRQGLRSGSGRWTSLIFTELLGRSGNEWRSGVDAQSTGG